MKRINEKNKWREICYFCKGFRDALISVRHNHLTFPKCVWDLSLPHCPWILLGNSSQPPPGLFPGHCEFFPDLPSPGGCKFGNVLIIILQICLSCVSLAAWPVTRSSMNIWEMKRNTQGLIWLWMVAGGRNSSKFQTPRKNNLLMLHRGITWPWGWWTDSYRLSERTRGLLL